MEAELTAQGASLNDYTLEDMDAVWNRIKQAEKNKP
jgi:uncharacterized protein YabN with tetrapyrrole methylase and pyrophosphatase domain